MQHIVVSFVATFKIWIFYLKIRITTFKCTVLNVDEQFAMYSLEKMHHNKSRYLM